MRSIIIAILQLFHKILRIDQIYQSYLYQTSDDIPADVQYCLVLGAKLFSDDSLTPMLTKRLDAAIDLFHKRPNLTFILSGDASKRISNDVQAMYNYLKQHCNIPDEQIILDKEGYTTLDSIRHITPEMDERGFILLTSEFHMPRSVYLCHRLGLHPYALHLPATISRFYASYRNRELIALVKNWYILTFGEPQFGKGIHRLGYLISCVIGKVILLFLRMFRRSHSNFPGRIALRLCPYLLQYLTKDLALTIIVVGTEDVLLPDIAVNLLSSHRFCSKKKASSATIHCTIKDFYKVAQHTTSQNVTIVVAVTLAEASNHSLSPELIRDYILCGMDYLPHATIQFKESFLPESDYIHRV